MDGIIPLSQIIIWLAFCVNGTVSASYKDKGGWGGARGGGGKVHKGDKERIGGGGKGFLQGEKGPLWGEGSLGGERPLRGPRASRGVSGKVLKGGGRA
jgi:hypothetical protein